MEKYMFTVYSRTLQRQNTEILKQIFPEKEYRGLSPNFHIHASVSDLYIPTIGLPNLLEEILYEDRSWDYINWSQTHECGNWGWGRSIPRKGIHKWDFRCSVPTNWWPMHRTVRNIPSFWGWPNQVQFITSLWPRFWSLPLYHNIK